MGNRKEYTGTVLSCNMQKTIVVRIERLAKHPKYGRILKITSKFKVHDELSAAKPGDTVTIREVRPISKEKRFILGKIIKKATIVHGHLKDDIADIIGEKKKVPVKPKEEISGGDQENKAAPEKEKKAKA